MPKLVPFTNMYFFPSWTKNCVCLNAQKEVSLSLFLFHSFYFYILFLTDLRISQDKVISCPSVYLSAFLCLSFCSLVHMYVFRFACLSACLFVLYLSFVSPVCMSELFSSSFYCQKWQEANKNQMLIQHSKT